MAVVVFYLALILLVAMLAIKYFGVSLFSHRVLSNVVSKNEETIHTIAREGKQIAAKIRFENFHRLFVRTVAFAKREAIHLKRKFDSQQPKFFLQAVKPNEKNKNSVSFFLRSVSEHKNSLKKRDL